MALTKKSLTIFPSAAVAANGTKASPAASGVGQAIDLTAYYGGLLTFKFTNGGSAPGVPINILIQVSEDGTNWADHYTLQGDTTNTNNSVFTGSVGIDRSVMFLRVVLYGNTTNPVTALVMMQAIQSL